MHRLRKLIVAAGLALLGAAVGPLADRAWADSPPVGGGSYVPSGSRVTSTIGTPFDTVTVDDEGRVIEENDDKDHFVFDGYAGQLLTVSVAAPRTSALLPMLDLFAPDGRQIGAANGARIVPKQPAVPRKSVKLVFKLDQSGIWTIRVRGQFPGTIVKGDNPATQDVVETNYVYVKYDYSTYLDENQQVRTRRTKGDYVLSVRYPKPRGTLYRNANPGEDGLYRFPVPASGGSTISGVLTFRGGTPTFVSVTDPTGRDLGVPASYVTTTPGRKVAISPIILPAASPLGPYTFTFSATTTPATRVMFRPKVVFPKSEKPLKSKFSSSEPVFLPNAVNPPRGGPNIQVSISCSNLIDPGYTAKPRVFLGRIEIPEDKVVLQPGGIIVTITTPGETELPIGLYDVKMVSSAGQAAVLKNGFEVVQPPEAHTIDPAIGSSSGGYVVTITGERFNTAPNGMRVGFRAPSTSESSATYPPLTVTVPSSTKLQFTMPSGQAAMLPGTYLVSVKDAQTQRFDDVPQFLTLTVSVALNRVTPGLVPTLGGEQIFIKGSNFSNTDVINIETQPGSGEYEEFTGTFVSSTLHQLEAPVRNPGTYRVFIYDPANTYSTPTRSFSYYKFSDYSAELGITGTDGFDGWTTALGDLEKDGDLDLFVSRKGGASVANTTQTRVLRNKGTDVSGAFLGFEDVTSTVMPATVTDDDWRAERIRVADVNTDGYDDIVIVTDAVQFPSAGTKSHLRFLMNERRSATSDPAERAFRDRTADLAAPIRKMSRLYGGSGNNDTDDWRGKDLWVGDLDAANVGPPEIVITGEQVFENYYVSCTPYCASPYSGGYTYSFYWGGTRVFKWDQTARGGLGRYKFDANYFPRKGGITVAIFNPPPGIKIPTCAPNQCRGTFTPFTGQRLAVGPLDPDGKPDFAVLNKDPVMREGSTISSLQVALNVVQGGSNVWDVTDDLTGIGAADFLRANTVAIGSSGFPDGGPYGMIAIAKDDPTGVTGSALRFIRYVPTADPSVDPGDFEFSHDESLPAPTLNDKYHASDIAFLDVDDDGDEDLVTVARTPPGGSGPAFRIFRNEVVSGKPGVFTHTLDPLIEDLVTGTEHFEGDALAVGDLDGDDAAEFLITLATTGSRTAPFTRAIHTVR